MGIEEGDENGLGIVLESVRSERRKTVRIMILLFFVSAIGLTVYAVLDSREQKIAIERILKQIDYNSQRVGNVEESVGILPPESTSP